MFGPSGSDQPNSLAQELPDIIAMDLPNDQKL